jgi:hypothetical protein
MLLIRQQQLLLLLFYFFVSVNIISFHIWKIEITRSIFVIFIFCLVVGWRCISSPHSGAALPFVLSGWEIRQLFHFHFVFLRLVFLSFTWNNDCINVGGRRRNMSATRPF